MAIQFPVVPSLPSLASALGGATLPNLPSIANIPLPGIPAIQSFPGFAQINASIQGNVLTVTEGLGAIAPGLSLSGMGLDPTTIITSPLTAIQDGIGTAFVNVQQNISNLAMTAVGSIGLGSLGGALGNITSLLGGDVSDLLGGEDGPSAVSWGIFLDGAPVIVPDSVIAVDFKRDWHIADYPVEGGKFESYNKVRLPYDARVIMVKEGTEADRGNFLTQVAAAADSLDLYTVVMPEVQYANANVVHFDFSRKSTNGVTLLTVAVWLQEVRVEAVPAFTNTATPSAADQVSTGVVQAVQATAAQAAKVLNTGGVTGAW